MLQINLLIQKKIIILTVGKLEYLESNLQIHSLSSNNRLIRLSKELMIRKKGGWVLVGKVIIIRVIKASRIIKARDSR